MSTTPRERSTYSPDGRRRVLTPLEARRAQFQRYKEDVKKEGKPFYPFAMFHDTVMSLAVVCVIVALAVIWKYTAGEQPDDSGWLGPLYKDKADPGTTSFVPRPDWYFYFLFYLLRIFKWPESVLLGTIGIPTIALVLLLAMPFLDVRRERRLARRPVALVAAVLVIISMGVLTYKGATAQEAIASELRAKVPVWIKQENLVANSRHVQGLPPGANGPRLTVRGAQIFSQVGCLTCHTYLGSGSSNLGAPNLTDEGAKGKGIQFQINHLQCPACVNNGSPMPSFAGLGNDNLLALATFLESSKGKQ